MGSVRRVREGSPSYARISNFMGLFTNEECAEWAKEGKAPDWVVQGITFFMERAELMERLAKDD